MTRKRSNDKRRAAPASAANRKSVSWNVTQAQIDARLEFCADPDVHGASCVCTGYRTGNLPKAPTAA